MKIAFLCKGSRGDVLPLLALATQWRKNNPDWIITIACTHSVSFSLTKEINASRIEIVELPNMSLQHTSSDGELLRAEVTCCLLASRGSDIIIFNLFALEGWYIANHLSIPCVAASPFLLNRAPPENFFKKLEKAHPRIYHCLQYASPGQVSMAEVEHWMWRLFLDDLGSACASVGMQNVPFLSCSESDESLLPSTTPLLYGISPSLLQRQPFWPSSVQICGNWDLPPPNYVPSNDLVAMLESMGPQLVYIGFGSMETLYSQTVSWKKAITNINAALAACNMHAIWQCFSDKVEKAFQEVSPGRMHIWKEDLPHNWLFERCCAVVHHGGIGTTTTALKAGLPVMVCPFQSDQYYWAEQLNWLGVGVQCRSIENASINDYLRSFKMVLSATVSDQAKQFKLKIQNEDGIKIALHIIEQTKIARA